MSNLLQDGYNLIDGYRLQQDAQCSEYFKRYLNIIKPERILELGTAGGGLTKILRDHTDVPILTVEKEASIIDRRTYELADVYIEDFLDTNFINKVLIPFISLSGRTLVLCDGFNKKEQYRRYARYIKNNDVIAVHDYFISEEYFTKNIKGKKWNWCQITEEEIKFINEEYKMVNIGEELNEIFWGSKLKKGKQKLFTLI